MPDSQQTAWKFVTFEETIVERFPEKSHHWHCHPDLTPGAGLLFVRCRMLPGYAHAFHRHPKMEEILYVLSGEAEQWVENEKRIMKAGDSLYLAANVVHGTYNPGSQVLDFLAVLSPAGAEGPGTVDVSDDEPWKSLRPAP